MESTDIIIKLKNFIKQLKIINTTSFSQSQEETVEIEDKESLLLTKIVGCFNEILSNNFNNQNPLSPKSKENNNNYWSFISKHFNTPLVRFCIIYDKSEIKTCDNYLQKGETWIFLSILEKSFCDSVNEIYQRSLDELYYKKNSLLRKYKNDIISILSELKDINLDNIKSKDYQQYLNYLEKNPKFPHKDENINGFPINPESPIPLKYTKQVIFSNISMIPILTNMDGEGEAEYDYNIFDNFSDILPITKEKKDFCSEKDTDFAPSIIDNFYTFVPNLEEKELIIGIKDIFNNNLSFGKTNSINNKDSDDDSSKFIEKDVKPKSELVLNPKIPNFLPTDKLYEINEKTLTKEYNKNDKLIYKKKSRPITNCLLLYLNNYYKKALYHKFYKHNLNNRPISLKEQNYQCYICLKKFSLVFNIPIETVCWCSYYMRYVCENCIDDEYSIIPHFILDKWCFKKFSISKKAKNTLLQWYNKPVIYFKKNDILLKKVKQFHKVIEIKKVINNIFDIMKCENKFNFLKETLREYEYLALKEYLFSIRDLVEINNNTFYTKIEQFKKQLINHISGDCPICKFEGEICTKCCSFKKIFFYDIENIFYCKICRKSYHKKCIGLVGHVH